ncbi:MAG: DUF262 domain-containing protein [Chloroflexi bacterium]|nr:DUF262 domain-containing protein [Chloroflexota bacterium]
MIAQDDVIQPIPSEEEDRDTGVPLYRIRSYPGDPPLQYLYDKFTRGEITVPKWQREFVWSHSQASKLIESFLLGLPVPSIFLYKEPTEQQVVIDGQQRLRTVQSFIDGVLPDGTRFYLKNVDPRWEGKEYATLDEAECVRLRDSILRVVTVEQLDPRDDTSIYHIFERLNTGGTALSPQEVRNAVYHGPFNDSLVEINEGQDWRKIFGRPDPDLHKRDVELILRFLALWEGFDSYTKPMKQFLNSFMKRVRHQTDTRAYKDIFLQTVTQVVDGLGQRPFHITRGINVAVYDSVMVAFARSQHVPSDVKKRFRALLDNPSFKASVTAGTTDVDTVKGRIRLAREVLFA